MVCHVVLARSCPPDSLICAQHTRRTVRGPRDRRHKRLRVRNFVRRIGQNAGMRGPVGCIARHVVTGRLSS